MKKNIAEDLPARKYPAGSSEKKDSPAQKEKERGKNPDDRVKKALDDIRYRSRREGIPLLQAYSQYMQTSSMPQQEKMEVKQRLFGKEQSTMKAEDFNIQDFASSNVANALYKVFVEKYKEEDPIVLPYIQEMENAKDRKYSVEVIDKDGTSYDRHATREKISKLRANPNIKDVVMKKNDKPERSRDDDEGKKDYDRDGKIESGAKEYRGSVHNAIQKKIGGVPDGKDTSNVKEQFIGEIAVSKRKSKKSKQLDVMIGKNTINMSPKDPATGKNQQRFQLAHYDTNVPFIVEKELSSSQKKFISMLDEKMNLASADMGTVIKDFKASTAPQFKGKSKKKKQEMAIAAKLEAERKTKVSEEMDCETDRKKGKDDMRSIPTKMNLRRNELGAMGLKMSYEPDGEDLQENPVVKTAAGIFATYLAGQAMRALKPKADERIKTARKVSPIGGERRMQQDSYEPEGEVIDERRRGDRDEPVRQSSPAVQFMKKKVRQQEGKPPGQRKKERGGSRQEPETPTQKRLRLKSQQKPESSRDVDTGFGIRGYRSGD